MKEEIIQNEYRHNARFREYVDRYSKQHRISVDESLKHEMVRQTYLYYTEV